MITLYDDTGGPSPSPNVARERRDDRPLSELPGDVVAVAAPGVVLDDVDWSAAETVLADDGCDAVVLGTSFDDAVAVAWSILDPAVARLAVDPTPTAVLAFRSTAVNGEADPWRCLTNLDPSRMRFVPGAGTGDDRGFPELAPESPAADRRWVGDACRTVEPATLRAGLLQANDFLEESHTIAQDAGHVDGDYWHAIMHRREPDPSNSKYWWRQVGAHPVFPRLAEAAAPYAATLDLPGGRWDPAAFVDACERARADRDPSLLAAARRVQWIEMLLLLRHCAS